MATSKRQWSKSVKDILLINVSGHDKPGVTSAVTAVLSRFAVTVLDIGQAVIHDQLNLGILAAVPQSSETAEMTSQVQSELLALGMHTRFQPISEADYQHWVEQQASLATSSPYWRAK